MKKKMRLLASALVLMLIMSVTAFAYSPQAASPVDVISISNSFEATTFAMPAYENHTPNFVGPMAMGSEGVCEKKTFDNYAATISIGIEFNSGNLDGAQLSSTFAPFAGNHPLYANVAYDKGFVPLARDQPQTSFIAL